MGGLQFSQHGKPLSGLISATASALLAYLVVSGRTHSQTHLAHLFWGDLSNGDAKKHLHRVLHNLRKLLGLHLIVSREGVAFNTSAPYWCDVEHFERVLTRDWLHDISPQPSLLGTRAPAALPPEADLVLRNGGYVGNVGFASPSRNDAQRLAPITDAVELYRGEFLAGLHIAGSADFDAWLNQTREHLQQLALAALTKLVLHYGEHGESGRGAALRYARRIIAIDPLCEEAYREVMMLLAKGGQHSAALAQYETCCRVLQRDLGRAPSRETTLLYERIRAAAITPRHGLPPSDTPLMGRERELSDLSERIAMPHCALIGIVGPSGVGKTRLVVEAGLRCGDQFGDGVYFVAMAALNTQNAIVAAIAESVGCAFRGTASPKAQLLRHLSELEALLILDSAELLLADLAPDAPDSPDTAASLLRQIARQAPGVKLLLTSREADGLSPDQIIHLNGLAYPKPSLPCHDLASCLAAYPALRLFVFAAQRANEDYELQAEQLPHVSRLCQLLQGLPLAIEVAAAWASVLLVDEVTNEISHNLDFLNDHQLHPATHHHALLAAFEYAWARLTAEDKSTLRRLSVFRGAFTLEAVEQILGAKRHTLLALVDRALLQRWDGGRGGKGYVLHEALRQFAQEQLRLQPEEGSSTLQRYADYYTRFVKTREAALVLPRGVPEHTQALAEIEREIDNIATAWQVALARKQLGAIDNAFEGLHRFYHLRARFHEGYEAFERAALVVQSNGKAGASVLAAALATRQAYFMFRLDHLAEAKAVAQRSLEGLQRLQHRPGPHLSPSKVTQEVIFNTQLLGTLAWGEGDFWAAQQWWQQALEQHEQNDNHAQVARAQNNVAVLAIETGDLAQAKRLLAQSLQAKRAQNDWQGVVFALENLANVALLSNEVEQAQQLRLETLTIAEAQHDAVGVLRAHTQLGYLAYLLRDQDQALGHLNEARRLARAQRQAQGLGLVLCNLSLVHAARGELDDCRLCLRSALQTSLQQHDAFVTQLAVASAAVLAATHGQAEQAVAWGEWAQCQPATSIDIRWRVRLAAQRWLDYLAPDIIGAAQTRGRLCSPDQIVDEVLGWLVGR